MNSILYFLLDFELSLAKSLVHFSKAQSSVSKSGLKGVHSFWQTHTVVPPTPWTKKSDMFQLALNAKENNNIDNLLNSLNFLKPETLQLDEEQQN